MPLFCFTLFHPLFNCLTPGSGRSQSDFNKPQYHCSDSALFLHLSVIRYTHLCLEGAFDSSTSDRTILLLRKQTVSHVSLLTDGTQLLLLPEKCQSSVHIYRGWLLTKIPYVGCHIATRVMFWIMPRTVSIIAYDPIILIQINNHIFSHQTGKGNDPRLLKLHYFDRLLQRNMTGVASCQKPQTSPQIASPLVTCGENHVTVKLPLETRLIKVKELGKETQTFIVKGIKTLDSK